MKVFFPALFVAGGFFIVWIALLTALIRDWIDRACAYVAVTIVSILIYAAIVGLTFNEYATDYLPDYLIRLLM